MAVCTINSTTHVEKPFYPMTVDITPKRRILWKMAFVIALEAMAILAVGGCGVFYLGYKGVMLAGFSNSAAVLQMSAGIIMLGMGLPQMLKNALTCWKKRKSYDNEDRLKVKAQAMAAALLAEKVAAKGQVEAVAKAAEAAKAKEVELAIEELKVAKAKAERLLDRIEPQKVSAK